MGTEIHTMDTQTIVRPRDLKMDSPLDSSERLADLPETLTLQSALEYLQNEAIAKNHAYFIQIRQPRVDEESLKIPLRTRTVTFSRADLVTNLAADDFDELTRDAMSIEVFVNVASNDPNVAFADQSGSDPKKGYVDSQGHVYQSRVIDTGLEDDPDTKLAVGYARRWNDFKEKVLKKESPTKKLKAWLKERGIEVFEQDVNNLPQILLRERNLQTRNFITQVANTQKIKASEAFGGVERGK